jgi:hypothetical protein
MMQDGDFLMLNNTDVVFQLFTPDPDSQLVQSQESQFQILVIRGIQQEIQSQVSFLNLQPGITYTLEYSFSIKSFKYNDTKKVATAISGKYQQQIVFMLWVCDCLLICVVCLL